jgi:hypothetical protein
MAAPADSPISQARANADAELKKALSVIDPLDFRSNVAAFDAFIHATKLLFNEEVSELLHSCIDSRTFKGEVARLHKQIVDEYAKPPSSRKMTKRERLRFERPMTMDEKPPFQATDKWDLFAPTILLPNKKHFVRKALRRVLGDQLRYWLLEGDRTRPRVSAKQIDKQNPATSGLEPKRRPFVRTWFRSGDAILTMQKSNGTRFEGLVAQLLPNAILVSDTAKPIEVGDMLIRILDNGLRVGFIVDDPGYREALGPILDRFEIKAHLAAPIDSLESSDFWRSRRTHFEELSRRQRDSLGLDREHPRWLRGFCSHLDDNVLAYCDVDGGLDSEFRSKFEEVTTQAAIALGCPPSADPVEFWLTCLCLDLLQNSPYGGRGELLQSVPGGGFFVDLLASSAAYCSRLAARVDVRRHRAQFRHASSNSDSPMPESETPHQATSSEFYQVSGKSEQAIVEEAMEPLVKIPPEARARIRAKEAKANEQYALVRKASENDVERARAEWGGYIDLFQEQLHDAIESARSTIDTAAILCAQFVFVAHAVEYRRVASDPGELEEVLAKLREAVIRQYGEHTRASVQFREAEAMEKALAHQDIHLGESGSSGTIGVEAPVRDTKKRGRRSNPERREAIRKAIEKHGEPWRDHLAEILTELDSQEVPLGDFQGRKIDLGDGQSSKVSSWDDLDLAQDEQRRQVLDALRKYLD